MATVQEPKFSVELREDAFEVRRYEPRVVAETHVAGERKGAENLGFRRLARYIFGQNEQRTKVPMTAPVGARAEGRTLAMTGPVGERAGGDTWTISFTMPEDETLATLPEPTDSRITLRELPARRVGVVTFSGPWTARSFARHAEALRAWLSARGLRSSGDVEINRYDPPWRPWFMRRNEVWIPLDGSGEPAR